MLLEYEFRSQTENPRCTIDADGSSMLDCKLSFYVRCAEKGVVFTFVIHLDDGVDEVVYDTLANSLAPCVTGASGSTPTIPEITTRSQRRTMLSHLTFWKSMSKHVRTDGPLPPIWQFRHAL